MGPVLEIEFDGCWAMRMELLSVVKLGELLE